MPRSLLLLCVAVVLVLPASAQQTMTPAQALYQEITARDTVRFSFTPIGLCEDYPEETTTMDIIRRDMELLKRTGVKVLRISFGWDGIETAKDQYDWGFWDEYVRMAVDDYGITLIPYICYTPLWNSTSDDPNVSWHMPPKDYEEFGEFMFDLVTRYKDRIKTWELWNEPDLYEIYWTGPIEDFARLMKIGSDAVRRADPEATVVLGGIAYSTEFVQTLFRDHGLSPYFDVVNMHAYFETWNARPIEDMASYIHQMDDVVDRYGDGQPLWLAEVGYGTYRDGPNVSESYTAYYDYEHTVEYQPVALLRTLVTALSTERLDAIAWYEIKDLPPSEDVIGDNFNNRYLGVAYPDHSPKPAEAAIAFSQTYFGEPMRSLDGEVTTDRPLASDVVVHTFEQEDGDVLVAAWLKVRTFGEQPDISTGTVKDTREESVRVTIPRALGGAATQYSVAGEASAFEGVTSAEEATSVDLTVRGGEIVLLRLTR